jgi:putative oxidoreductase
MKLPAVQEKYAVIALRVIMGVIFITHGFARLYYNSVGDFGNFLNAKGFVVGVFLAWVITIGELVCGSFLALGYKVKYCVIFHAVVILSGIVMVHAANGWFVVGHGSGGIEYSVLILAVLFYLYSRSDSRV